MKIYGVMKFRHSIFPFWISRLKRAVVFIAAILIPVFIKADNGHEFIRDSAFDSGYAVISPLRDKYKKKPSVQQIHSINIKKVDPAWRLVQWGSTKSLVGMSPVRGLDGSASWSYEENRGNNSVIYKRVTLTPDSTVSGNLVLGLELNGLAEFEAKKPDSVATPYLPDKRHHWPHLLMMQEIETASLDHYQMIDLKFDARLVFDRPNIKMDFYDKNIHAARFVVAFLVKNTLHGGSFWLMLVVYDDRFPEPGFSCKKCKDKNKANCQIAMSLADPGIWSCGYDGDRPSLSWQSFPADLKKGTQHMIFRIPSSAFQSGHLSSDWQHHELNLLPYLDAAISAYQEGEIHQRKPTTTPIEQRMFYTMRLFSVGWEITGLNHAAAEIKNISLKGY